MYSVTPSRRLSRRSASLNSEDKRTGTLAPRYPCTAGLGRSVGNSNTGGAPFIASCHQESCEASTSPFSQPCCHTE